MRDPAGITAVLATAILGLCVGWGVASWLNVAFTINFGSLH